MVYDVTMDHSVGILFLRIVKRASLFLSFGRKRLTLIIKTNMVYMHL